MLHKALPDKTNIISSTTTGVTFGAAFGAVSLPVCFIGTLAFVGGGVGAVVGGVFGVVAGAGAGIFKIACNRWQKNHLPKDMPEKSLSETFLDGATECVISDELQHEMRIFIGEKVNVSENETIQNYFKIY
jgi:hypothetical protein